MARKLVVLVLAGALAGWAAASADSASTDPQLCLDGGWQQAQEDDGSLFKKEHACLKYVDKGGVLYTPRVTIVVFCFANSADLGIFASGFHPGSVVTLTLSGALWQTNLSTVRTAVTGDGSGSLGPGELIIQPTLAGVDLSAVDVTLTMRDAQGVNATASDSDSCLLV
jgi:hypothetical protein